MEPEFLAKIAKGLTEDYERRLRLVETALCRGGEEQYTHHVTHEDDARRVMEALHDDGLETEQQWAIVSRESDADDDEGIECCRDEEHAQRQLHLFYGDHASAVVVHRTATYTPWVSGTDEGDMR